MNGQKTAGKTKDSAQNHIRQVVNPQIEPGEANQRSQRYYREKCDQPTAQGSNTNHGKGSSGMPGRKGIETGLADQLFFLLEQMTWTGAANQMFDDNLAHQVRDRQPCYKTKACIPPGRIEEKGEAYRPPDQSQIAGRGSGDHNTRQYGPVDPAHIL